MSQDSGFGSAVELGDNIARGQGFAGDGVRVLLVMASVVRLAAGLGGWTTRGECPGRWGPGSGPGSFRFSHLLLGQCRLGRVAEQLGYGGLDCLGGRAVGLPLVAQ